MYEKGIHRLFRMTDVITIHRKPPVTDRKEEQNRMEETKTLRGPGARRDYGVSVHAPDADLGLPESPRRVDGVDRGSSRYRSQFSPRLHADSPSCYPRAFLECS